MSNKNFKLALVLLCVFGVNCDDPEVEIPQGRLRGRTRINRDGDTYYSFHNIPYAKPPLGELRFKASEPADNWEGIRDVVDDLPFCVQMGGSVGQEDCLYLNVYVPALPSANISQKAVMVWIHGGAFNLGSGGEATYGSEFILTKDVVLVAINYRIGIFGFLSLDDPELGATGNAGMKDQVLALKWVKDNIEYFGGDPNNIMIFGESAGGTSVHLQVLSPMSNGLFNKAIMQSGMAVTELATPAFRNNAVVIAEDLGISSENWAEMLRNLQDIPAESLSLAELILSSKYDQFSVPIVEIPSNEPSFLPEDPLQIIKSGNYNQVSLIVGFNDADGLYFQLVARQSTGESILITDFSEFIPNEFQIEAGSAEEAILSQRIKNLYYGDTEPSRDDISGAVYLTGEFYFGFPAYRCTLEHMRTALYPIYFYLFTADTSLNFFKKMDETLTVFPGAAHADDLGYLYYMSSTPSEIEEGSVEDLGIKNMVNLWTNFAIYRNPTPENFDYKWEPVQEDQFNYLHIDTEESTLKVDPIADRFQFWLDMYAEYTN